MGNIISETVFDVVYPNESKARLVITIGIPEQVGEDWACEVGFCGAIEKSMRVYGGDSLQALGMALRFVEINLSAPVTVFFPDSDDVVPLAAYFSGHGDLE